MSQKTILKKINLPACGLHSAYCCNDCRYMSKTDSNRWGEYYCGKFRKYYSPSDNSCRYFECRY